MKRNKIKPYPYQMECLDAIDGAVEAGKKRALVVMASGLGKTYTSAFAVEKYFADRPFVRVLILCHSEKILTQTKDKFKDYFGEEFSYGMYVNDDKATRPTNFLFATFQTMKKDRKNFQKDEFTYIIVDEAHHSHACTYFPTICYFQPEFLLGLTATPDRLDGQKIEEIYGDPVYELDFVEATNRGLITECDYRLVLDDLSQEQIDKYLQSDEKVSINQLNRTLFMPKRDEEIVRLIGEYSADVEDPKTMIFCKTIAHARKIAKLMQSDDVALIHNSQSDSMNACALQAFRDGEIRTIISVQMLNEGIDVPDANIIVFLRNTVSPTVFYQQLGRGTRLAPGKQNVRVLDFVGNCDRIKMVLELNQEISDFGIQTPVKDTFGHGDGDANSREKFVLNIATPEFKSSMVDIVGMLGRIRTRNEHGSFDCEEDLFAAARLYAVELGHPKYLTSAEIDANLDFPCCVTLRMTYHSISNFLKLAGLEQKIPTHPKFETKQAVKEAIQKKISDLGGKAPTTKQIEEDKSMPSIRNICKFYPSYNAAIIDAGGKVNNRTDVGDAYPDNIMKEQAHLMQKELGRAPTIAEWEQNPNTCPKGVLARRHGSYNKAMIAYGITPNPQNAAINPSNRRTDYLSENGDLTDCLKEKLQSVVRLRKRELKNSDLGSKNGLPSSAYFRKNGWTLTKLNREIEAERIISEIVLNRQ